MQFDTIIQQPTAFILGAGTSIPFKFPSGPGLVESIINASFSDFMTKGLSPDELNRFRLAHSEFRKELYGSRLFSIDEFLRTRSSNPDLVSWGKLLVALLIRHKEYEASERDKNLQLLLDGERDSDWMRVLWDRIKCPPEDFVKHKIVFITFNYDRLLEMYLTTAMQHAWGITATEAWNAISKIPIIHVHGKVGDFAPGRENDPRSVPFDEVSSIKRCKGLIDHFRMWHEPSDSSLDADHLVERLRSCRIVGVLGVGQAGQNLQEIVQGAFSTSTKRARCFATGFQLDGQERFRFESILRGIDENVMVTDSKMDAARFLRTAFPWHICNQS